ncbi:MAG: homocysteine S-methyltransferase family protein [Candidatus Coatesbacteria bacterium]|nr:homocysteine S-methyltransferase family protein [Candidatus Coatesbacteria bacterium]
MSAELAALLTKRRVLIVDGAMGTMLQQNGLGLGDCPELFNIDHADVIQWIHEEYLKAGADLIITNTFGGSPKKLAMFGENHRTEEINRAGAELAAKARRTLVKEGTALVFGSVGPTGELLEPLGTTTPDEMLAQFVRQIQALKDGGVDGVIVETMLSPEEAIIAARAAKAVSADLAVIVNLTYDPTPRGPRTVMGTSPEAFLEAISGEWVVVDGVGTNCGTGADDMMLVVESLRAKTDLPIAAYPNAGMPRMKDGVAVYDQPPEEFADKARRLFDAGATMIGGCCGTTPEHIRLLSQRLSNVRSV